VTILVSTLVRLLPGDVINATIAQYTPLSDKDVNRVRHELGLDKGPVQSYLSWAGAAVHGDLGHSLATKVPVSEEIKNRLPVTLELGLIAMAIGLLIAVPVGILSGVRQDTWIDYLSRSFAIGMLAIPSFWLGTLVMVYPNKWWRYAPPLRFQGLFNNPRSNLEMMIIPGAILGISLSGTVMRLTRTQVLEVMRQDYIRTAWAKGLRERVIIMRHGLRNALLPVITVIGLQVPVVVGGAVLLETIFSIPGIGRYLVLSVSSRDYPVIQGVDLLIAVVVVFCNLAVDLSYSLFDPRVRFQ
jgi:peptide/nickel transport system permease protein